MVLLALKQDLVSKSVLTSSHVLLVKVLSHTLQFIRQAPEDGLTLEVVLYYCNEGHTTYSHIYIPEPLSLNLKGQTNPQMPEKH